MDWANISAKVEHALTLDVDQLKEFLQDMPDAAEVEQITRLMQLSRPITGFLATSAPDDLSDFTILEKGTRVAAWKIESHVGRGGMGDVYRASRADGLYDQTVALKIIQGVSAARAELFEIERQRLALMSHSGIARIIDGGSTEDGRPYMAMDFIDGQPIVEYTQAKKCTLPEKLTLFLMVCDAVEHAHSNLVLHRDIKSDNVLIDVDGTPRLIDFGISYDLDRDAGVKGALSIATAAPEQLLGEPISVQTDVFSLGVLLHEMITGVRPKRLANGGMEANKSANIDRELLAIIDQALSFSPTDRYVTVTNLIEDVSAFMEKRPVIAFAGGWRYKLSKFIQRYPLANGLAAIALISIVAGLAFSLKFAADANTEALKANAALEEAELNLERSEFFLTQANLFHATQSAYADSLQSLFGNEADVERLTQVLNERWQQAYDLREKDPANASFISYAIGRHFLFRNDYLTAIKILKPWVDEAYGPEGLIGYGTQLLAIAYMQTGQDKLALPMLRETEKWLASGFDAESPDHIASATQIATITNDEKDVLRAEELLLIGLEKEQNDQIVMYFWNQISLMRQIRGDFGGAYEARKAVVDIIEQKPLMERSGTDTGILNLIDYEVMHSNDLERANYLVDLVLTSAPEDKGESREMGIAYSARSLVRTAEGNLDAALNDIEKAIQIATKYAGENSRTVINMQINRAELLADLNDTNAMSEILSIISRLKNEDGTQRMQTRTSLAEIYITLKLEGVEAGQAKYDELMPSRASISKNLEMNHMFKQLQTLGITAA